MSGHVRHFVPGIGYYCACGWLERDCEREQRRLESNERCVERTEARRADAAKLNPIEFKIKLVSTRTGRAGWIRTDGTPTDHETEAGRFDRDSAEAVIAEYTETLVRVVGRCANTFTLVGVQS